MTEPIRCRLDLPLGRPPKSLWGNSRSHWGRRCDDTHLVRTLVLLIAKQAGLHRLCDGRIGHVTVSLTWAPGDRRARDADNLWPMLKVSCDALARGRRDWVGLDLVPDDTPRWMTKHAPCIAPPPAPPGMWLDITLTFDAALSEDPR